MKAWVSREPGGPSTLRLEDRPVPRPGDREIVVRVRAVGINYTDGLMIADRHQVRQSRPFTPGSEFCGGVVEVGAAVSEFHVGQQVAGLDGAGALAEYVVVDVRKVVPVPASTSPVQAAALLFTATTAYYALRDVADLRRKESIVVLGAAGGIGTAAIRLARTFGARVIACASSQEKADFARAAGAHATIVYDPGLEPGDGQKVLTRRLRDLAPEGIDVVLDPVGGAYSEPAMRSLQRGGRYLVVGFPAGIPRIPLNVPLLSSSSIIGVDWGHLFRDQPARFAAITSELLDLFGRGLIAPLVSHEFRFADAPAAIQHLQTREALGKVVVVVDDGRGDYTPTDEEGAS